MAPMAPMRIVPPEETERDIAALLDELGMTVEDLREEARTGMFRSEDAALAWFTISSLVGGE